MTTVKAPKKGKKRTVGVKKDNSANEKRRKPFPALPTNDKGETLNKYTGVVSVGRSESLPPDSMFMSWYDWAQTARTYYKRRADELTALAERLMGMTEEEREAERNGVKAHEKAQKNSENPIVQQLAAEKFAADPASFLASLKSPEAIAQFLAQAQAIAMEQLAKASETPSS